MQIDDVICSPRSGILRIKCSGEFGVGTSGNPSAELLGEAIGRWVADHRTEPVVEIEIDYSSVDYSWGDGPVSSMVPFLADGVKCRIIASSGNCDSLKNLLESCNLPWFELVRIDEVVGGSVLTPVPLRMRISIPFDEGRLSARAREFATSLFRSVPELKNHAYLITNRNSEECDLRIRAESPTGDPERRLDISMDADAQEPRVTFRDSSLVAHATSHEGRTILSLIEGILHDRIVIGVILGGPCDGTESFVDLGDPLSLKTELTGPCSSGRLQIVSWGGSADREVAGDRLDEG